MILVLLVLGFSFSGAWFQFFRWMILVFLELGFSFSGGLTLVLLELGFSYSVGSF